MDTAAAVSPQLVEVSQNNAEPEARQKFDEQGTRLGPEAQYEYNNTLGFEFEREQHRFYNDDDQYLGSDHEEVQDEFDDCEDQDTESELEEQNEYDDLEDGDIGSELEAHSEFDNLDDQNIGSELEETQNEFNGHEDQYSGSDPEELSQLIQSEPEVRQECGDKNIKSEFQILSVNENKDDQNINPITAQDSLLKEFRDLKNRLPRTVLEECVVELVSMKKCQEEVPKSGRDAIIIIPTYRKRMRSSNIQNKNAGMRDILADVEVVYSDEDEPGPRVKKKNPSSAEFFYGSPPPHDFLKKKYKKHSLMSASSSNRKCSIQGGEKLCECPICGRKFHRNCSLALHMKCHTDQKKCACKVCGKEFLRVSMLKKHKKLHRALYSNPDPAASFLPKSPAEQNDRLLTQDPNMRFSCKQCNVTFKTKQLLELHFHLTHKRAAETSTSFSCQLCRASFTTVQELKEHSVCHSGSDFSCREKLHVAEKLNCNICKVNFTYRTALLRHYKKIHQIDIMDLDMDTASALLQPQFHQVPA